MTRLHQSREPNRYRKRDMFFAEVKTNHCIITDAFSVSFLDNSSKSLFGLIFVNFLRGQVAVFCEKYAPGDSNQILKNRLKKSIILI